MNFEELWRRIGRTGVYTLLMLWGVLVEGVGAPHHWPEWFAVLGTVAVCVIAEYTLPMVSR